MAGEFALFQGVAWDTGISQSMRPLLIEQSLVSNRTVLDLFCGPGVIAVTCGYENAKSVLALAPNEVTEACARYNVAAHAQDAIVTVRSLDRQTSPPLAATQRFEVILATLANASVSVTEDIQILTQCVAGNLELSGRVFVVCEDDEIVARLKTACEPLNWKLDSAATQGKSSWPVFEIQRPPIPIGPAPQG